MGWGTLEQPAAVSDPGQHALSAVMLYGLPPAQSAVELYEPPLQSTC